MNLENEKQAVIREQQEQFTNAMDQQTSMLYQILDLIPASIYWKDRQGRYLGCNKFVLDMAGLISRDNIIGKTDKELPWKEFADVLQVIDSSVLNNNHYHGEEYPVTADGKRTFMTNKVPLVSNKQEIIKLKYIILNWQQMLLTLLMVCLYLNELDCFC